MSVVFLVTHRMVVLIGLRWKLDQQLRADLILIWHSDKDTVEQKIMENNKIRFQLTESTPPMNEPLLSNLGFLSDTDATKRILNGTYICPEGVDAYTKNFIASPHITTPIRLTSSPTLFHCKTTRRTGNGVRNTPPPPYLVCTLVIGRLQLKAISSPNSMLSSLTSSSPPVTLPSGGSKGYRSCLKRRRGYADLPNSAPSY